MLESETKEPPQHMPRAQAQSSIGLEHASSDIALLTRWSLQKADLNYLDLAEERMDALDNGTDVKIQDESQGSTGKTDHIILRRTPLMSKARSMCLRWIAKRTEIVILKNVAGSMYSGELVGILGPSGSGKTTLLSILAGSTVGVSQTSRLTGNITFNSLARDQIHDLYIGFVPQNDYLISTLTVFETLWYSCVLRSKEGRKSVRVDAVIKELDLSAIRDRQIGGHSGLRGISGGELRRVSIGTELVTSANILILDEPTSGLDSFTAYSLLQTCKQICQSGRIVVSSLHQPSADMYALLDRVMLMSQGRFLYTGPASQATSYFALAGVSCTEGKDIAEHMLFAAKSPFLADILAKCCDADKEELDDLQCLNAAHMHTRHPTRGSPRPFSFVTELAVLSWRTGIDIWRNPSLLLLHICLGVVAGVLCGAIFRDLSYDIAGAQGRLGAVFFSLCLASLTSLTSIDLLSHERRLVIKEIELGYYRAPVYYLTKVALDGLVLRALPTAIYCIPLYTMTNLNRGKQQIATFFCVLATFAVSIGALSMAVATGVKKAGKAAVIMNIILLIQLLMAGYFKDIGSITPALRWIHWISPFFYAFETLVVNEARGLVFKFKAGSGVGATLTGDAFLDSVHLNKNQNLLNVGLLDVLYLAFVVLGIGLLLLSLPSKLRLTRL